MSMRGSFKEGIKEGEEKRRKVVFCCCFLNKSVAETEKEGGEMRARERDVVWVKEGNLISVLIKPNLF